MGGAQAVHVSGRAEELAGDELQRGIEVFGRVSQQGVGRLWVLDDVRPPSPFRLYRATAGEHFVLIPGRDPELASRRGRSRRLPLLRVPHGRGRGLRGPRGQQQCRGPGHYPS